MAGRRGVAWRGEEGCVAGRRGLRGGEKGVAWRGEGRGLRGGENGGGGGSMRKNESH